MTRQPPDTVALHGGPASSLNAETAVHAPTHCTLDLAAHPPEPAEIRNGAMANSGDGAALMLGFP